jgi:glycosyltransferase involved in cell wall biosynthesis
MEPKIKVLHMINSLGYGGAEMLLIDFVNNWRSSEYEIHVGYIKGSGELRKLQTNFDVRLVDFSHNGKFTFYSLIEVRRYIIQNRISILHTHDPQSGILSRGASWSSGRRIAVVTTRHTQVLFGKQPLIYKFENLLLRGSDAVVCISESVQDVLVHNYGIDVKKTIVLPNSIDTTYFSRRLTQPEYQSGEINIGSVGRLIDVKGFDVLIDAFAIFHQRHTNSHLSIIGDGVQMNILKECAIRSGLRESVAFLGYRDRNEVKSFLENIHIFVLPSRQEGFGIALIEAMAMCVPVIGSNIGGIKEIIDDGNTGLLFESDNPKHLAEQIELLAGDKGMQERLKAQGRLKAEQQYSINTLVDKTKLLYDKLKI